ncbi:MAG: AI-2E family transporter [Euzebyales bacterium]|nr:AI-2E family transporter [Euzebyales bacterium]
MRLRHAILGSRQRGGVAREPAQLPQPVDAAGEPSQPQPVDAPREPSQLPQHAAATPEPSQGPQPGEAAPDAGRRHRSDRHPVVRLGSFAWALVGVLALSVAVAFVVGQLSIVCIPLVLALFPAAVLAPPATALKRRGFPDAAAALVTLLGFIALMALVFRLLTPSVAGQLEDLSASLEEGYAQARRFLESGPLGLDPVPVDDVIENARDRLASEGQELGTRALEAGIVVLEGFTGLVLGLFALFFYLKDGPKIAAWVRDLFPRRFRGDAHEIGDRVWFTIGAYIRGLLVIGLVDATAIGVGLVLLRVPLALPLAVLVFFGALFPIVGAFLAGTVAVLVALATQGLPTAVAVLVLIVVVQQVEGHILAPVLLGRATELHPLAVISALTAGAILLGVLGAFLSVPVAASAARAVGYLRDRTPDRVEAPTSSG